MPLRREPPSSQEREQSRDLRFVWHELGQEPFEADSLRAEVLADKPVARARRVALIEDEVDDSQHGPKAALQRCSGFGIQLDPRPREARKDRLRR